MHKSRNLTWGWAYSNIFYRELNYCFYIGTVTRVLTIALHFVNRGEVSLRLEHLNDKTATNISNFLRGTRYDEDFTQKDSLPSASNSKIILYNKILKKVTKVAILKYISSNHGRNSLFSKARFPETAKIRKKMPKPDTIFFEKGIT